MLEYVSSDVLVVLFFLLPGFIAAWTYYGLTSFPKPGQFERIVQAFIFTIIVQVIMYSVKYLLVFVPENAADLPENTRIAFSVFMAFVVGAVFARFANNDKFHAAMRWMRFTQETSYPSEWYSAFANHKTYIVLHLNGQRRLYGWPVEWPSDPDKGHFALVDAEWLTEKDSIKLPGVDRVLIPTSEVEFVEFMQLDAQEAENE